MSFHNTPTPSLESSLDPVIELISSSEDLTSPSTTSIKRKGGNLADKRPIKMSRGKNWSEDDSSLLIHALLWNEADKKRN